MLNESDYLNYLFLMMTDNKILVETTYGNVPLLNVPFLFETCLCREKGEKLMSYAFMTRSSKGLLTIDYWLNMVWIHVKTIQECMLNIYFQNVNSVKMSTKIFEKIISLKNFCGQSINQKMFSKQLKFA